MSEKKVFFSFFKGISKPTDYSDEEMKQREYALSQASRESIENDEPIGGGEEEESEKGELITEDMVEFSRARLDELLRLAGYPSQVMIQKRERGRLCLEIINNEDVGRIIGKEGANLEALQIIVRAIVFKKFEVPAKIFLDAGEYRQRRQDTLKSMASRAAKTVIQKHQKVELKPMGASDRRIIHMMFKNNKKVRSFSVGEGSDRHIVLEQKEFSANRQQ